MNPFLARAMQERYPDDTEPQPKTAKKAPAKKTSARRKPATKAAESAKQSDNQHANKE